MSIFNRGIMGLGQTAPPINRAPTSYSTTITGEDIEGEKHVNKSLVIGGIIVGVLAIGSYLVYKGTKKKRMRRNGKRRYKQNPPRGGAKRAKRSYRGHKYYLQLDGRRYGPYTDGVAKRMKREHGGKLVRK